MVILQITDAVIRLLHGQYPHLDAVDGRVRSSAVPLADGVREIVQTAGVAGEACVLLVSRRDVVLKEMVLPSGDCQEVRRMAALQIPVIVPFGQEQVVYDCRLAHPLDSGYTESVIAVMPESAVQKYLAAARNAGLAVTDVWFSTDGIDSYLRKAGPDQFGKAAFSVVICMDLFATELVFYREARWVFSAHLSYGTADFPGDLSEAIDGILGCVRGFERRHKEADIAQAWLVAGGGAREVLKDRLSGVKAWQVDDADNPDRLPDFARRLLHAGKVDFSWLAVLGCWMKDSRAEFLSFLPLGAHQTEFRRQARKDLMRFCLAMIAAGLCVYLLLGNLLERKGQRVRLLEQQAVALDAEMERMRLETEFLEELARPLDAQGSVVRMVREIHAMLPDDVTVQALGMRINGGFDLQGIALKDQSVSQLQAALMASPFFTRVELQYTTRRRRMDKEYTEFKMIFYPGAER